MQKDGRPIRAIALGRAEIGHFPERQIELLRTFADQAVIGAAQWHNRRTSRVVEAFQARDILGGTTDTASSAMPMSR